MSKTMSITRAKAIAALAVSRVTSALDATDHTAPSLWRDALRAEQADDRNWYRNDRHRMRTAPERGGFLVLTMLNASSATLATLYGMRSAHRDATIIGAAHADKLAALNIDQDELRTALDVMGDARRA